MFALFNTTNSRLIEKLVYWILWTEMVKWTNFGNVHECEIGGEMTDFLHDDILWDGNM